MAGVCAAIGVWSKCGRLASPPPSIARRGGSSSGSRTNSRREGGIPFILFTAALCVCVSVAALPPPLPTILWKTGLEVEMLATTGREPVCFSLLDFCSRRLPSSRGTDGIQECTSVSLSSLSKKLSSAPTGKKNKNVFQAFLFVPVPSAVQKNTKLCSLYQEGGREGGRSRKLFAAHFVPVFP